MRIISILALFLIVGCTFSTQPQSNNNNNNNPIGPLLSNTPPVPVIAFISTVSAGQEVKLDGHESYDVDFDELMFTWAQESGSAVTFEDGQFSSIATFVAPSEKSTLVFSLKVSDGFYATKLEITVVVE